MTRSEAKRIAETISNQDLKEMFRMAKANIADWREISSVNRGMTKGAAWNVLAKSFDVNREYHILAKTNMVWEFGDFLPDRLRVKRDSPRQKTKPHHQEPDFSNY